MSVASGKLDGVRQADRELRDDRVVELYLAGWSLRRIAASVGLRSPQSVANVIKRELAARAARHDLAKAMFVERSEAIFRANWPAAMRGDYRAGTICGQIIDRQARFYNLY